MSSLRFSLLGLLGTAGLFVVGCDSGSSGGTSQRPINSTEATTTVNQRVDELIAGLADTTAQLDTTDSTTVATESINSALGSSPACPPMGGSTSGGSASTPGGAVDGVPESTTKGLDDLLHQAAKEAKDHVFREEFVEVKDGNQVVYKINPASACGSDTTCIEKLTRSPVRFLVTANADDTLNVSLLVGEARHTPGTALLGPKKLSVRVNLAEAMDAVRLFMSAEEQQDLPERLGGVIEGMIEKRAENDFAISGSVIEKFDLLTFRWLAPPFATTSAVPTSRLEPSRRTSAGSPANSPSPRARRISPSWAWGWEMTPPTLTSIAIA